VKGTRDLGEEAALPSPPPDSVRSTSASRRVSTTALFQGENEVLIEHRGQEYRLRITRSDKLILTK
jgi:hemin uptake protein HemP